jgi:hypothetical protein
MPDHATIKASRQPRWWLPLAASSLIVQAMLPLAARADTITYDDLATDTPTFIHTGTATTVTIVRGCGNLESPNIPPECTLALTRGTQTIVETTIPSTGDPFTPFLLRLAEDPQLQFVSDDLNLSLTQKQITFVSIYDGAAGLPCSTGGFSCQVQETGGLQGGTITWSGGGGDSIFIQSDAEPSGPPPSGVPEPNSWLLLVTGLIGLLAFGSRRRARPIIA